METKKNYKKTQLACYLGFVTQATSCSCRRFRWSIGPAIIGNVSEKAGNNLQAGVLAGIGFPIVLVIAVFSIRKKYK